MDSGEPGMPDGRLFTIRGGVVKRLRKERGWSRQALAARIGRSVRTVVNIERRIEKAVYFETLDKLATAFGVEHRVLLAVPMEPQSNGHQPAGEVSGLVGVEKAERQHSAQTFNVICETSAKPWHINKIMTAFTVIYKQIKAIADSVEEAGLGEPAFYQLREDLKELARTGEIKLHLFPSEGEAETDVWAIAAIPKLMYDNYIKDKAYGFHLKDNTPAHVMILAIGQGEPSNSLISIMKRYYGSVIGVDTI